MKVNGKDYPIYYGKMKNIPNHQSGKWSQSNFHGHVSFRQKPKGEDGPCSLLSGCQIEECWVSLMRLEITGNNHTFKKILGMWFLCLSTDWVWYFEIHISVASIHTKLPKLWWHYVEPLKSWKPKSVPVGSHVSSLLKSVVHLPPSSRIPPFVSRQFSREHMASANVSEPLGTPKPRLDIYMFNLKKKSHCVSPKS
jgi:hypothetical protein